MYIVAGDNTAELIIVIIIWQSLFYKGILFVDYSLHIYSYNHYFYN